MTCHSTTVIYKTRVKSSNCKLTTLAYHRRILFTDFFSQSRNGNPELATLIPLTQYLRISIDSVVQEDEADTTTYQIMKELQTCSEDDRQIALRTLRELLSALKEKEHSD